MATYAIGDVQGCYASLLRLLDLVDFQDDDRLWFTGDLVNRGPQSLEVLRFVKNLGEKAQIVLGNHDLHLLAIFSGEVSRKPGRTLEPVFQAEDCADLLYWLRQQPLLVEDSQLGYVMTHAGIPHHWSFDQAKARAAEVEMALKTAPQDYFRNMYGNKPRSWKHDLVGTERLRVITNYLTRMRFISAKGRLEFDSNGGLDSQPKGYLPWFAFKREDPTHRKVISGHWAALGFYENDQVVSIDTGCVWGNRLTAFRLEDAASFSVKSIEPVR